MVRAFIGLGSNLGQREDFIGRAIVSLAEAPGISLCRRAGLYETEPVGVQDQPWFLNTVVEIETDLTPYELLAVCKQIERSLGRQERERYGSREIDVDILLYDELVVNEPDLQIPHAQLHRRRFMLVPLAEIAPGQSHPALQRTIIELLNDLESSGDPKEVMPYDQGDPY